MRRFYAFYSSHFWPVSLSSTSADEKKTDPENKVGKIVFKENWPSQQFFIILFHAMNGNKNQKPLWFKWSS